MKKERSKGKSRDSPKARDEFRFNNNTNHPNYIFEESNGRYRGMGITHEPVTFGKKNMPLKVNPQIKDTRKAYVRNGTISEKKKYYSKNTLNDYKFSDIANVKAKKRNYKKNRKKSHKKTSKQHRYNLPHLFTCFTGKAGGRTSLLKPVAVKSFTTITLYAIK
ncbi:MAG: hypothetical protein LUD27_02715 [Clostridia bacterium]|nr:hypothetical protein [Clostridia bacterium]